MRWQGQRESSNVEDRRNVSGVRRVGGLSLGTIVVALLLSWIFNVNPLDMLGLVGDGATGVDSSQTQDPAQDIPENDVQARFVATVLASTEDVWTSLFKQQGQVYNPPKLVLFRGSYPTACGVGQAAMGPFYCPGDQKVYIDLSFFDTLQHDLGAPGEFAQAYVIAHEVGHHVQNLLGMMRVVEQQNRQLNAQQRNALSVRVELQADCYAGVWSRVANQQSAILEHGDIEAALNAASRIGDDALQRQSQGYAVPDSFTHGTSIQRTRWFERGLSNGTIAACDTFVTDDL